MAPRQVYGKRRQLYTNSALPASPVKPVKKADKVEICEVYEDEMDCLARSVAVLTVDQESTSSNGCSLQERSQHKQKSTRKPHNSRTAVKRDGNHRETQCISRNTAKEEPEARSQIKTRMSPHRSRKRSDIHVDQENVAPFSLASECSDTVIDLAQLKISDPKRIPVATPLETHASALLQLSSRPLTLFSTWSSEISSHFTVSKIAEASFGEVYRLSLAKAHTKLSRTHESVLKIIALKPPAPTPGSKKPTKAARERHALMSDPNDVAGEVQLLQRMTCIPGFTNFRDVSVLQGRPGKLFVDAWKQWNAARTEQGKEPSEFPDPGRKTSYSDDQLWAVIEMQDAGTDLENVRVTDVWMVWDVFWGVVLALGKGEEEAMFEHRDLHLGNICISATDGTAVDQWTSEGVDANRKLGFTGIETTIIDYTLSRATLDPSPKDVAYFDLEKDPEIFKGDAEKEYQYEMYRYMRGVMFLEDPVADVDERWDEIQSRNVTWRDFKPQTNLVWLHFLIHQLLEQICWPSAAQAGGGERMSSAASKQSERALELEKVLREIRRLLEPDQMSKSDLKSAGHLVALALSSGWLDVQDILGSASDDQVDGPKKTSKKTRKPAKTRTIR